MKDKKFTSQRELAMRQLKHRIVQEKGYSEASAEWLVERLASLTDYMQYGNAVIAYTRQDGTFCLAIGTLRYYECYFHRPYNLSEVRSTVIYWDITLQGWRTFQAENLLEWRAVVN